MWFFPFTVVTFSLNPHNNPKTISWDFLHVAKIAEGTEVYCLAQDNTAKKTLRQQHFVHQIPFFSKYSLVAVSRVIAILGSWAAKKVGSGCGFT